MWLIGSELINYVAGMGYVVDLIWVDMRLLVIWVLVSYCIHAVVSTVV